jgi:hypothetical protein
MYECENERQLACPTRATGSREGLQGQPNQNPAGHALTNTPDAAPSDDSACGIKVLVPDEATLASEHKQVGTSADETIYHSCRCPFCLFLEGEDRNTRGPMVKISELRRCALENCLICQTVSAVSSAMLSTSQDALSIELVKPDHGLCVAWHIDDSRAPLSRRIIASIHLFTLFSKSSRDGVQGKPKKVDSNGWHANRNVTNISRSQATPTYI